jgi:hypothetical protein
MAIGLVDGMIQRTHTARPVEAALKDDEDEDEYDVSDGKVGRFKRITPKVLKFATMGGGSVTKAVSMLTQPSPLVTNAK